MPSAPPTLRSRLLPLLAVALTVGFWCGLGAFGLSALGYRTSGARYLKAYRGPTSAELRLSLAMEYAEGSTEANDVLLLGDATCESISMAALERATGLRAWSLCAAGLIESDGVAVLLRRYLAHHPPPRLVVLIRHPYSLLWSQVMRSPGLARSRSDFLRRFEPDSPERPLPPLDAFRADVREGWWDLVGFAANAFGHPMNGLVNDCGRGAPGPLFGLGVEADAVLPDVSYRCPAVPLQAVREEYLRNRGGEGGVLKSIDGPQDATHNDDHNRSRWQPMLDATSGMEKVLHEATGRHVPVLLRFSPIATNADAQVDVIETWAQNLAKQNPGTTIAQPAVLQYDAALFEGGLHLNVAGAQQLTDRVIEDVRAMQGGGLADHGTVTRTAP